MASRLTSLTMHCPRAWQGRVELCRLSAHQPCWGRAVLPADEPPLPARLHAFAVAAVALEAANSALIARDLHEYSAGCETRYEGKC
jgi:hypothetical protein